jgi:transcriptional regulator with XRE-family HTH domain
VPAYLRLKYERQRRGWSQTTVGDAARRYGLRKGLSQADMSAIETGRVNPTDEELAALARVFHIGPPSVLMKPVTVVDPDEKPEGA